jgi:medium-chain acyl-[acyl-carrier-protein] hydrolase
MIFRTWQDGLPTDVEVCPVQLPGRGTRLTESPFTHLPYLIDALTDGLLPLLDQPFAFFGHSLGALISFEFARQLHRQHGVHPIRIIVSGAGAPHVPRSTRRSHTLPDEEFLAELRSLNGTPEEVLKHHELMQIMLPFLRADFALYETYSYAAESPLNCPISAFGGLHDQEVRHRDLAAWSDQTRGSFSIRMFPGDHFFLNASRSLLLPALSQELR